MQHDKHCKDRQCMQFWQCLQDCLTTQACTPAVCTARSVTPAALAHSAGSKCTDMQAADFLLLELVQCAYATAVHNIIAAPAHAHRHQARCRHSRSMTRPSGKLISACTSLLLGSDRGTLTCSTAVPRLTDTLAMRCSSCCCCCCVGASVVATAEVTALLRWPELATTTSLRFCLRGSWLGLQTCLSLHATLPAPAA